MERIWGDTEKFQILLLLFVHGYIIPLGTANLLMIVTPNDRVYFRGESLMKYYTTLLSVDLDDHEYII